MSCWVGSSSSLKLWILVAISNVAGTWGVAAAMAHTDIFQPRVRAAIVELGRHTLESGFAATFGRAVFAGWIIALMMWLQPAVKGSRVQIVMIMTYIVALGDFSHIIAGSVDCAFLVQTGQASFHEYAVVFFFPTLLGNIVGGTALVALLNYGQVAAELDRAAK